MTKPLQVGERKKNNTFHAELVTWMDHFSMPGWVEPDDIGLHLERDTPGVMQGLGWVVFENDALIGLSTTMTIDGGCVDPIMIAKKLVLKRKRLPYHHKLSDDCMPVRPKARRERKR